MLTSHPRSSVTPCSHYRTPERQHKPAYLQAVVIHDWALFHHTSSEEQYRWRADLADHTWLLSTVLLCGHPFKVSPVGLILPGSNPSPHGWYHVMLTTRLRHLHKDLAPTCALNSATVRGTSRSLCRQAILAVAWHRVPITGPQRDSTSQPICRLLLSMIELCSHHTSSEEQYRWRANLADHTWLLPTDK